MSRSVTEENKFIFDKLYQQKSVIEEQTGKLTWERLDAKKASRIKQETNDVSLYEKEDWNKMMDFMMNSMIKIEQAFKNPLQKINIELKREIKTVI